MASQTPKVVPKMAPQALGMPLFAPTIALPQTDKPNFEGAAVIPEGIVNMIPKRFSSNQNNPKIQNSKITQNCYSYYHYYYCCCCCCCCCYYYYYYYYY